MPDTLPLSDRRSFLGYFVGLGLGSTLFPGILWARVASGTEVNDAAIVAAAEIAGLTFSDDERKQMLSGLKGQPQTLAALRAVPLDNGVAPAIVFNPLPLMTEPPKGTSKSPVRSKAAVRTVPSNLEELCYEPVTVLSELVRTKKVTSTALTRMYLARLRRLDEKLKCVVTFTEAPDDVTVGLFIWTTAMSGSFSDVGSNAPFVLALALSPVPAALAMVSLEPPKMASTAGPALTVRVLPSSPTGIGLSVLPCADAQAWALAALKVKDACSGLMTTYEGPPWTRLGRLPPSTASSFRPDCDAASARPVAVANCGVLVAFMAPN